MALDGVLLETQSGGATDIPTFPACLYYTSRPFETDDALSICVDVRLVF